MALRVRGLGKSEKGQEVCAWYVYMRVFCVFCISSVTDMCVCEREREMMMMKEACVLEREINE